MFGSLFVHDSMYIDLSFVLGVNRLDMLFT